ncbi:hypothetical protein TUM4644_37140 [Shewanella colwelliana]|uniref:hypothetical protein n=1 Tax=Shewanella colwelliana TaxID=23 RepID=UPI001BBCF4E6|nr:hypothetical protein [Shewanella colwelliana]GIU36064.1 hypothetical protein TUM4644_37140 [Shewanella colwelliana]
MTNINLTSQLATLFPKDDAGKDYVLTKNVIVLGSGSAVTKTDDLKNSIITYTSDTADIGGITRVLYSLSDDFDGDGEGDFKVGAIDISVSAAGNNSSPTVKYFEWENDGNEIVINKKYVVDVASDSHTECSYGREPTDTKGSCIFDSEGDALQIVGVYAYDATVKPTNLEVLDSTQFDVTFLRTGLHDIAYEISDHKGGFASAVVRVNVPENNAPILSKNPIVIMTTESNNYIYIKLLVQWQMIQKAKPF